MELVEVVPMLTSSILAERMTAGEVAAAVMRIELCEYYFLVISINCLSCYFNVLVMSENFGINCAPLISYPVTETDWREEIVNVIVRGDTHVAERGNGSAGEDHAGMWLYAEIELVECNIFTYVCLFVGY